MTSTPTPPADRPEAPSIAYVDDPELITDRRRAFLRYKEEVARSGKPFFPFGVWHDIVAATVVVAIIIGMTVVWFAQANCDSWWNVSCDGAATPLEQELYSPGEVQKAPEIRPNGEPELDREPLLGPLYEDKADPTTTSYHPRPEWYFYFLFYLLIIFSHPETVIIGTFLLPNIWLALLIAWPFLDRKRERRPSRRPIAMAAMTVTAVMLLAFTYLGSKAGEVSIEGISEEQQTLPGFQLVFEDPRGQTCKGCHVIGGSGGNVGPSLDDGVEEHVAEGGLEQELLWQIQHLAEPQSLVPGSAMPPQAGSFSEEELAHMAAFLMTMGSPELATDPVITGADASTAERALGGSDEESQAETAGETAEGGSRDEAGEGTADGA